MTVDPDRRPGTQPPDPTLMRNQPALRTSSGTIWLVMGGLFAAASLIPLVALGFVRPGPSAPLAIIAAVLVVIFFAAMVVTRVVVKPGPRRLRYLMIFLLAMAATALIGVLALGMIEGGAVA